MIEWIENLHWSVAILIFWMVGIVRTSIVFMLGWLAVSGTRHISFIEKAMKTPIYDKARAFVNRWGVLAVPLCFFTLGFQTAVIVTTGFTRMPLSRWIPAMLCGTFLWGCIYGTVGMAVIWAWLQRPEIVAPIVLLLAVIILVMTVRHRRKTNVKKAC